MCSKQVQRVTSKHKGWVGKMYGHAFCVVYSYTSSLKGEGECMYDSLGRDLPLDIPIQDDY